MGLLNKGGTTVMKKHRMKRPTPVPSISALTLILALRGLKVSHSCIYCPRVDTYASEDQGFKRGG